MGMSMGDLITVIIPAYNAARYIGKTIRSVLSQTHTNFEIIVIDDGSVDSTFSIASSILDPRIRLYKNLKNKGISYARNRGIELARGDYLSFLDSDDLWTDDKLAAQLSALTNRCDADVAYSWFQYIDESEAYLSFIPKKDVSCEDALEEVLRGNFLGCGSNILIRRKVVQEMDGFNTNLRHCADWEYYSRLAHRYKFVVVPKEQIFYRIHSESFSHQSYSFWMSGRKAARLIFDAAPDHLKHIEKERMTHLHRDSYSKALNNFHGFFALFLILWSHVKGTPCFRRCPADARFKLFLGILLPAKLARKCYVATQASQRITSTHSKA
jgi:Glycosyltransferases involved in cell wall biogenesis